MRTLCLIAFLFANFPAYSSGNHDKNKHEHKPPEVQVESQGSSKKSNKGLYAVIGILGVTAVWQFGKNSKKEPEIKLNVKERE